MDTTYDEARRCYRCKELGRQVGKQRAPERHMGEFHVYRCQNERCIGFERDWIIQVRPDGTVPKPEMKREKSFPIYGDSSKTRIEAARANVDALLRQSLER